MAPATGWFETVAEAQKRAKKRLPRSVYSALLAGSEKGVTVADNVAAFGELTRGLTLAEVRDRINRHFEAGHPATMKVEDTAADIPLAALNGEPQAETLPSERVNQP